MLVIPHSQHYNATVIVVLQRQRVKLYEKANFVPFSMEIKCTSLSFLMITVNSLLIDLAVPTAG
jgi:hypothetical protein